MYVVGLTAPAGVCVFVINDARGASLTCGHLGGVVVVCHHFFFDVRAFGCSGIVADITKSTIAS